MKLYHASSVSDIKEFRIFIRDDNTPEYGDGIYFTSNFEQAKLWSCSKSENGAIYEVDIDLGKLKGRNLEEDELFYYLSYLNRINLKELVKECLDELDNIDYVHGKMLKNIDEFKSNAEKFNKGDINIVEFKRITKLFGKGYDQYCFKTDKAVDLLNNSINKIYYTARTGNITKVVNTKNL